MNKQMLIGRVGRDPETTGNVTKFSVATSEKWTKDGQKQERTDWHNVTAFDKTGEILSKYVSKGDLIYIEGKTRTDEYTDKDGNKRKSTSVIVNNFEFISGGKKEASKAEPVASNDDLPF